MIKSDELRAPFSCLNKAGHDEPIFVLRAKDPMAAQTVRLWAAMSVDRHGPDKVNEALELAAQMDHWRGEQPQVEAAPNHGPEDSKRPMPKYRPGNPF